LSEAGAAAALPGSDLVMEFDLDVIS